jgi:hypothetical protein
MKLKTLAVLSAVVFAPAVTLTACQKERGSHSASTGSGSGTEAVHAGHAGDPAAPALVVPVKAEATVANGPDVFTGSLDEIKAFIGYYHSIRLTPEQERLKVEALSAMKAPCCSQYSLATCCCPCNMAKAAWGLAARLITEKGYHAEQIRQAEASWLKKVNPNGFSGNSCFTGGCSRAMRANGCGGMKEESIVF